MNTILKSEVGYTTVPTESILLEKRRLFLEGEITNDKAMDFIKNLMVLSFEDLPIQLFINSPGGSIDAGFTILDALKDYPRQIETFCIGRCYSMAAIIFILSENRYIFPSSKIMLHEPLISQIQGQSASEVKELSNNLENYKKQLIELLSKRTHQTTKYFEKALKNDTFYSAEECLKYNFTDKIVTMKDIKEIDLWNMTN